MARETIHGTDDEISQAVGRSLNGSGVRVAVVDTGINNIHLNGIVEDRIYCNEGTCRKQSADIITGRNPDWPNSEPERGSQWASHGTQVAQVLAASGMSANNGIAPGVELLDARYGDGTSSGMQYFLNHLAHALDWSHTKGADIANLSTGLHSCNDANTNAFNLIVNETVDKGMFFVKSAGNMGFNSTDMTPIYGYNSITGPGCAYNAVTVGGIDDRNMPWDMFAESSRGSSTNFEPRLMPHIVAPAHMIETLDFPTNDITSPKNGTSYAAPQVSATAAMMLQLVPELTPAEIKVGLLLGANWQGPVPCNSVQYERNNPNDNCSYARQPINFNTANNAASLGILNNVGFGILNTTQTLKYVDRTFNVVSDYLDTGNTSKDFQFFITDTSEPVKVILTWMAHPHGCIMEQVNNRDIVNAADLDFTVSCPGMSTINADSTHQTTEFAVFMPSRIGQCTVTVSGSDLDEINKPIQNFALASTFGLNSVYVGNSAPVANSDTYIVSPGQEKSIRLKGTDTNDDNISFHVSSDPEHGITSTPEIITKTTSRLTYTPDDNFPNTDRFRITPDDGTSTGDPVVITLVKESLPSGATNGVPGSLQVTDWDTYHLTTGPTDRSHSRTFPGPDYDVTAIHIGSNNMESVELHLSIGSDLRKISVPESGARLIEFALPLDITSVKLIADAIDEQAVDEQDPNTNDVRMFVGYVSAASCPAGGATGATACTNTYQASTNPNAMILDNTDSQSTTSAITVPSNIKGNIASITTSVDISHTHQGDLKVILTAPDGTEAILHNRSGGGINNIISTWDSASHTELRSLLDSDPNGDWILSVGDYGIGDVGLLERWSLSIRYTPANDVTPTPSGDGTVIFSDSFDSLNSWNTVDTWNVLTPSSEGVVLVPGSTSANTVLHTDDCDDICTITSDSINLDSHQFPVLSFWRFIDSALDRDEFLKVELYNGSSWNTIYHWSPNLNRGDDKHVASRRV